MSRFGGLDHTHRAGVRPRHEELDDLRCPALPSRGTQLRLAAGESSIILLHPPSAFSRGINRNGEGMSAK